MCREFTTIERNEPLQKESLKRFMVVLLKIEGNCSTFRAKLAHFVGHLPPGAPWKTLSPGQGWLRRDGDSLGQSEPGSLTSQTQTRGGSLPVVDRIVEPLRLCPLLFGRFDVLLNLRSNRRDLLPGVFRIFRIGLTHGFGLPFTDSLPHEGGTVGFSHITAVNKEVDHAHITAIVIDLNFPASQSIEQAWTHIPVPLERKA